MISRCAFAKTSDIEKLIKARFDYFKAEKWEMTSEQRAAIEANLRQYFAKRLNIDFFAAVIEENGQLVSVAFLAIAEKPTNPFFPTGKTGTILNVYTCPEYRQRGYATNVIGALIEEAKRQDLSYIELSASESGKSLYQKLGFQETPSHFTAMRLSLL